MLKNKRNTPNQLCYTFILKQNVHIEAHKIISKDKFTMFAMRKIKYITEDFGFSTHGIYFGHLKTLYLSLFFKIQIVKACKLRKES